MRFLRSADASFLAAAGVTRIRLWFLARNRSEPSQVSGSKYWPTSRPEGTDATGPAQPLILSKYKGWPSPTRTGTAAHPVRPDLRTRRKVSLIRNSADQYVEMKSPSRP